MTEVLDNVKPGDKISLNGKAVHTHSNRLGYMYFEAGHPRYVEYARVTDFQTIIKHALFRMGYRKLSSKPDTAMVQALQGPLVEYHGQKWYHRGTDFWVGTCPGCGHKTTIQRKRDTGSCRKCSGGKFNPKYQLIYTKVEN